MRKRREESSKIQSVESTVLCKMLDRIDGENMKGRKRERGDLRDMKEREVY